MEIRLMRDAIADVPPDIETDGAAAIGSLRIRPRR
jgi:hypothetical protein